MVYTPWFYATLYLVPRMHNYNESIVGGCGAALETFLVFLDQKSAKNHTYMYMLYNLEIMKQHLC